MNKRKNCDEIESGCKVLKPENEFNHTVTVAEYPDARTSATRDRKQKSSPSIFKLHGLACDDLFDYLSFKELHSLGQTCLRMNRFTGLYFQLNFRYNWLENWNNRITINAFIANGFSQFAKNISIDMGDMEQLRYCESKCRSIKSIRFNGHSHSTDSMIDCLKNILAKVERVEFVGFLFIGDFYQSFSEYCPKLKSLRITSPSHENCFFQKYAELEHIALPFDLGKVDNIETFFAQNTKIHSLEINAKFLFTNQKSFSDANMKIDELTIHSCDSKDLVSICSLLNDLHVQNLYKRLRIIVNSSDRIFASLLSKLPQTERIIAYTSNENIIWPVMENLKEVEFGTSNDYGLESLVSNAVNIEYAVLSERKIDKILYLMGHAKKLKKIKIEYFDSVLDISTLNDERKNLKGAQNVIIYLEEIAYLTTKWAFGSRKFELIEIRRHGQKSTTHVI